MIVPRYPRYLMGTRTLAGTCAQVVFAQYSCTRGCAKKGEMLLIRGSLPNVVRILSGGLLVRRIFVVFVLFVFQKYAFSFFQKCYTQKFKWK